MNNEELENLIQEGENERIEFKSTAILTKGEEIASQMVAFANRYGGKILFGVADNGEIEKATSNFDNESLILSHIAKDKCSPVVILKTETVHHPDGNVLVAEIYRRRDIPHAVVDKPSGEIKKREYYIRTVNGKRLVSDRELAYMFQNTEFPHLKHSFRIFITYSRENLGIPAFETPKYINYFGPLLKDLLDVDKKYLLEKEPERVGMFFLHLAPFAMLEYFVWIFSGSWLTKTSRRPDITVILPLKTKCGSKIIELKDVPISGDSFLSHLSTNFGQSLVEKGLSHVCVPPETRVQIIYGDREKSKRCTLKITRDDIFDFEFAFVQYSWMQGLPIAHPRREIYERMDVPYERSRNIGAKIATVELGAIFKAEFGFPDIVDPFFEEHYYYGRTILSSIEEDWDWDNFVSKLPESKLYVIEDKLDELLVKSDQILSK